jgi:high mobility group protein B1
MSTKSWDKLSNMVSEVLSGLDKKSTETVMAAWNNKKKEVAKLLGESTRSSKRQKDPNAPKKPNTSYIIFCGEHRDKVRKEHPEMSAVDVTSRLGELWKSCKDRKKYEDAAERDKNRYETEMSSYVPPVQSDDGGKRTGRGKKERTGPKRPLTAYMYFCQENRDVVKTENPNMNGKEITTELGVRWKRLTDAQKAPYEAKQSTDKTRYESEKASSSPAKSPAPTKSPAPAKTPKESKAKPPKESKAKGAKESKTKKKEDKSKGYELFLSEQKEELESENPSWNSRKITTEVSKRWKELSDEDRDAYERDANLEDDGDEVELEDE